MARCLSNRSARVMADWVEGYVHTTAHGGGAGAAAATRMPVMGAEMTYPIRAKSLDHMRDECQLTPLEYNHIARVQVQAAQVESAELRRARIAAERQQDEWAAREHGPIETFNTFLAYLFCAPSEAPRAAGHAASVSPLARTPPPREPDLVFLDGSAAAALERARDGLTPAEYDHMLQTQLRLAELDEEAERDRAKRMRPRKLPLYASEQPRRPGVRNGPTAPSLSAQHAVGSTPTAANTPAVEAHDDDDDGFDGTDPLSDRIDSSPALDRPRGVAPAAQGSVYSSLFGFSNEGADSMRSFWAGTTTAMSATST